MNWTLVILDVWHGYTRAGECGYEYVALVFGQVKH